MRMTTGALLLVLLTGCLTTPQEEIGDRVERAVGSNANQTACDESGDVTRDRTAELGRVQQGDAAAAVATMEAAAADLRRISDKAEGDVRDAALRLSEVYSDTAAAVRANDTEALASVQADFKSATTALSDVCGGTASEF